MSESRYIPLVDKITDLHNRGYTLDFTLVDDEMLFCPQQKNIFDFNEFEIIEVHSFHFPYHNSQETFVLAIESYIHNIKGILVVRVSEKVPGAEFVYAL